MLTHTLSRKLLTLAIAGTVFVLSGCVTIPDVIQGTSATPVTDISSVQNAPSLFTGAEARFGGRVAAMVNERDRTILEIAAVPLDSGARPILGAPSQGRILATVNGFLDPVDFRGQLVTVVGPITGIHEGKIGMTPYRFVTMDANGFKRWHITQQIIMPPQPIGPWGPGWGPGPHRGPWGQSWGGWYNPAPAQIQTIVTQ
ncbi:Slp family lipoprotein [Serratia sp. UGAL515B_01]|uniref:Slp family lipoprotein n=1 Tax=Serratia sp. UGAL515B_01 TaxID=2986763 RepID=UPI002952A2FF|nr:Slp family lipoprotein [Serratia sp. UGAL515B_01]WON78904.1 Slp family lipoprotein [Serratia sp. UGAL515B_01]